MGSCPGNATREGGLSEKSDWGKLHRVLSQKDFNRNKKDSNGQSRKKEGFAQISCDRGGPKPSTGSPMGSSKIELSGERKPNSDTRKAGRSSPTSYLPNYTVIFPTQTYARLEGLLPLQSFYLEASHGEETWFPVLVTCYQTLHQIPLLLRTFSFSSVIRRACPVCG